MTKGFQGNEKESTRIYSKIYALLKPDQDKWQPVVGGFRNKTGEKTARRSR